jgi:arginyl-tRNA synthetase
MDKKELAEVIAKKVSLKREEIESSIEIPPSSEVGDFAFPCFKLASSFKKNPAEIAKQLQSELKITKEIIKIEAKGPYLNFFINKENKIKKLFSAINENYGKSKIGKNKKIVIDFSGPNVGKPMHIGHIRSTIIGDSFMRVFDFLGYEPTGINYLGDIGLHIGKLIVAWELWLDKKALKQDPIKELLRLYVKFCENEKSEVQEETEEESDTYANNEWTNKAREKLKMIEVGDKKAHEVWKEIRDASGKGFDKVYKLLNVNFNETTGQSKFGEIGKEIITNALKKGLASIDKETGAVYVDFKDFKELGLKYELPKKYILRSNGTASYITQDIGALVERQKKYKFDEIIYVTDYRQIMHFEQLFAIIKKFKYDFSDKCKHVPFGTVNFGKEILATREGKIILLEDVLKKTIEKADEEIKKRKTKGDKEAIGVGAVKYVILRNEPRKDVEFSWDIALNFEGDSGPYLQYSYARASSILRKAKIKNLSIKEVPKKIEIAELELLKKIEAFPELVQQTAKNLNPQILANYSFQLAQLFNDFYSKCKVIGEEEIKEKFRLALVQAFRQTLKNSLYLLGIEVMEEM